MHEYTCMHGTYKYMHVIAWYGYKIPVTCMLNM